MMWQIFTLLFFSSTIKSEPIWSEHYANEIGFDNPLFCTDNKKCLALEHCPEILTQMNQKALPVHRFRRLVCGYIGSTPKMCCDLPKDSSNPMFDAQSASFPHRNTECGKSLIRSNIKTLGTFPFVARIGFINVVDGEMKYPCSGTIINEMTIFTTASCALATSNNYKLHSVLLGEFDTATNPDCNMLFCGHAAKSYNISYVVKHPDFQVETFRNNVALIRLKTAINFTVTVQTVCIPLEQNYNIMGTTPTLVGWGKLSNQREKPTRQQWLPMKVLGKQECSAFANRGFSVELCAAGQTEPCSGYSGSPLVLKNGDTYSLVGILSHGSDCDINTNTPSVFVNVRKYTEWILENS